MVGRPGEVFFFLTHPEPLPPSQPDGSGSSLNKTFQPTFWKSAGSCAAFLFQSRFELLSQHLGRSCKTYTMRGLLVLLSLACLANAQHQALIDYLERRLLAIEVSFFLQSSALQIPPERKLSGTRKRQWNADGGKFRGKCWIQPVNMRVRSFLFALRHEKTTLKIFTDKMSEFYLTHLHSLKETKRNYCFCHHNLLISTNSRTFILINDNLNPLLDSMCTKHTHVWTCLFFTLQTLNQIILMLAFFFNLVEIQVTFPCLRSLKNSSQSLKLYSIETSDQCVDGCHVWLGFNRYGCRSLRFSTAVLPFKHPRLKPKIKISGAFEDISHILG